MYRNIVTYLLSDGSYISEMHDCAREVGEEYLLERDGKFVMGKVVAQYAFDLLGEMRPV